MSIEFSAKHVTNNYFLHGIVSSLDVSKIYFSLQKKITELTNYITIKQTKNFHNFFRNLFFDLDTDLSDQFQCLPIST